MKVFLLCSVGHFGLFLFLSLVGLDFSGVDGQEPGLLRSVAGGFAGVLGQPALFLAGWLSSPAPDALEWVLLVSNSLLWGAGLSALLRRLRNSCPPDGLP